MKKRIACFALLTIVAFGLLGCNAQENADEKLDSDDLLTIACYHESENAFEPLALPVAKQKQILSELEKLEKQGPLYDENHQYLGLDSAYNEGSYLITVGDDYTVEVVEDHPYAETGRYWYNVTSDDRTKMGIYTSSTNLKETIRQIIAK